jgi:P27 family predicted phage terminase small subunit
MRGRKPIPPEQKLSAYGLSSDAADIPKAPGEPEMPPGFDAEHAAEWDAVIADLRAAHTLSREIGATVEVYVRNLVRMRSAEASVAELGAIVHAPKTGVPMQNPYLAVANRAAKEVRSAAAELGLTPSSRGRVSKVKRENEDADEFADI